MFLISVKVTAKVRFRVISINPLDFFTLLSASFSFTAHLMIPRAEPENTKTVWITGKLLGGKWKTQAILWCPDTWTLIQEDQQAGRAVRARTVGGSRVGRGREEPGWGDLTFRNQEGGLGSGREPDHTQEGRGGEGRACRACRWKKGHPAQANGSLSLTEMKANDF